jgi:Domain of unknown function (DUF1996)/Divergent InlB B-repeat domain
MSNPRFWRVIVTIVVSALAVSTTPPSWAADTGGSFILKCRYSHTLSDDPIVHPYQPGASHSHDFFGNESTNAFSTYDAMISSDTSCRLPLDTAGYWVPTPYLAGVEFHPSGRDGDMRIYYLAGGASSVKTIPAGLQFIGGDFMATGPLPTWEVRWYCGAGAAGSTPISTHPYDCTPYAIQYPFVDGVVGVVNFPRCWDGAGLAPTDIAYPVDGAGIDCPSGFPELLPLVSERVHFGIWDPCAGAEPCGPDNPDTKVALTLASGPYYTLHADFWNTWQQPALNSLVANCVNGHVSCRFPRKLTVTKRGTGSGKVTSAPAGIACGRVCLGAFGSRALVSLSATPAGHSHFTSWSGACSGKGTCRLTMDHARSVTATFDK